MRPSLVHKRKTLVKTSVKLRYWWNQVISCLKYFKGTKVRNTRSNGFLSKEGPSLASLETLDLVFHISAVHQPFLYFDLHFHTAYAADNIDCTISRVFKYVPLGQLICSGHGS